MPALLDPPTSFMPEAPYSYTNRDLVETGVMHLASGERVEDFLWEDRQLERRRMNAQRLRVVSRITSLTLVLILWLAALWAPPYLGGPSWLFYVVISLPLLGVAVASALALREGCRYDEKG